MGHILPFKWEKNRVAGVQMAPSVKRIYSIRRCPLMNASLRNKQHMAAKAKDELARQITVLTQDEDDRPVAYIWPKECISGKLHLTSCPYYWLPLTMYGSPPEMRGLCAQRDSMIPIDTQTDH